MPSFFPLLAVPPPIFVILPTGNRIELLDLLVLLQQAGAQHVSDGEQADLTALFVASDAVAYGVLRAVRRRNLAIPDKVALVGFDDIPTSRYVFPSLTTVRLPAFGLGWAAADLLIRLINRNEIEETQIVLETELVVRRSCGALGSRVAQRHVS